MEKFVDTVSDRLIPRVVPKKEEWLLAVHTGLLLSLPNVGSRADAVLVLPGQGEYVRQRTAIALWESSRVPRHMLVAGSNPRERTWEESTLANLAKHANHGLFTRREGVLIQAEADNTRVQAQWVASQVRELGITSIALVVTAYHMFRAFGTMVTALHEELDCWKIPVVPVIAPFASHEQSPETGQTPSQFWHGELARVVEYRGSGHVLTAEEFEGYFDFLTQHNIFDMAF